MNWDNIKKVDEPTTVCPFTATTSSPEAMRRILELIEPSLVPIDLSVFFLIKVIKLKWEEKGAVG